MRTGFIVSFPAPQCIYAVPDDLVMNALKARLSQLDCATRGWILHGYPKTPPQAELLIQAGYEPSR